MSKVSEKIYSTKEIQKNLDRYLSSSVTMLRGSIYRYSNFSLKKVVNLAGSLRKTVGKKMLKKIQTSRKSDW